MLTRDIRTLAEPERHPLVARVLIGALGLSTLLPVFGLLATSMVLSNIAHAEESTSPSGALDGAWRSFAILGAFAYFVLFAVCGWRVGPGWRRCRGYLAVFSAYSALMFAFMVSGNFLHQVSRRGVLYAVGNNWAVIAYVVVLASYCAVLVRGVVWERQA